MKKIICVLLVLVLAFTLVACGNRQAFDMTYTFDRAVIKLPNGEIVDGKITSWRDFDGDQIQVKIDGKTYLVHSSDIAMIAE